MFSTVDYLRTIIGQLAEPVVKTMYKFRVMRRLLARVPTYTTTLSRSNHLFSGAFSTYLFGVILRLYTSSTGSINKTIYIYNLYTVRSCV